MKRKLSLYWICQISGWSINCIVFLLTYFIYKKGSNYNLIAAIFLEILIGLFLSHLMHLFWKKSGIVKLKVIKQIISILFVIGFFASIYSVINTFIYKAFSKEPNYKFLPNFSRNATYYFILFSFWNLIYFLYYHIEINREQQIAAIRLESALKIQQLENANAKLEFQKNIADVSLIALRSQMNPHFIFNCLNSIKLYTAQNDTVAASEYLTRFSKLIRLVMEESVKEKILLSSELDMLRLYIDMEAMRFKEKLQYKINIEKDVETDYTELPPLLLQPYIENAIWHGLMPKEEGGKIDIDVAINNDKSLLEITIADNGIGRAKSAELKSKSAATHKSYGMKVTSERIALLNHVYKTGADVRVYDLFDNNAKSCGTKVIIQIPV